MSLQVNGDRGRLARNAAAPATLRAYRGYVQRAGLVNESPIQGTKRAPGATAFGERIIGGQ